MWGSPCRQLRYHISGSGEADMPKRQLEALMWEQACEAIERAQIKVTLSAGVLIVSGERPLPSELGNARIHRLEIPHGHFQRRIELPPARFEISGRHLANGCLKLQLHKV